MGNLGKYQDIVTEAKRAGGVDALIKIIEDTAIGKRSRVTFAKGVGAGVLLTCVVAEGAVVAQRFLENRAEREALANEARDQLWAEIEGSVNTDGVSSENGEHEGGSNGGKYA